MRCDGVDELELPAAEARSVPTERFIELPYQVCPGFRKPVGTADRLDVTDWAAAGFKDTLLRCE